MVPLAEFLAAGQDEREGKFPYIWAVDQKQRLMRLLVTEGTGARLRRAPAASGAS
jgi:pyruvate-ferredoxin/flavodoxin oxidoreductase